MSFPLRELWPALRATYWFVPAVLTALAVALSVGLVYLDHSAPQRPSGAMALFFPTSVEGSRALLSAIVSSMMTVVAVTFSVTIVALTVSAQHHGPRLLNSFMRDRTVQVVLGILIGTFAYSVLVLGSVQSEGQRPLHWATVGAMALVAVSVIALIAFVHHVSVSLQVSSVAVQIVREFEEAVVLQYPPLSGVPESASHAALPDDTGGAVLSEQGGYLQHLDEDALVDVAARAHAIIRIVREPGRFLLEGGVLARVQPAGALDTRLAGEVNAACIVGRDRTTRHDGEFAIKQLVEIALRALSPGVNEPFTAITCIDRLGELLAWVARRGVPPSEVRDGSGRVRLVVPRQTFAMLLRAAFDPLRIFAGVNPAIYARLLDTIAALADVAVRIEDLEALRHQISLIDTAAQAAITEADDAAFVRRRAERATGAVETALLRITPGEGRPGSASDAA